MRSATIVTALIATLGTAQLSHAVTSADPFCGSWTLNPDHSQYAREPPPERMTIVIDPAPEGLSYRSETHYSDGRTLTLHYVARFDGVPALVVGTNGFLAPISLSRPDDTTIDAVYRVGLKKSRLESLAGQCGADRVADDDDFSDGSRRGDSEHRGVPPGLCRISERRCKEVTPISLRQPESMQECSERLVAAEWVAKK